MFYKLVVLKDFQKLTGKLMFYKLVVLKDFEKFAGKHLCSGFFFYIKRRACNSIKKDLRACTFVKKRPKHSCFPVNFGKIWRTHFLHNTFGRLLVILVIRGSLYVFLTVSTSPPYLFLGMVVIVFYFSSLSAGRPFLFD